MKLDDWIKSLLDTAYLHSNGMSLPARQSAHLTQVLSGKIHGKSFRRIGLEMQISHEWARSLCKEAADMIVRHWNVLPTRDFELLCHDIRAALPISKESLEHHVSKVFPDDDLNADSFSILLEILNDVCELKIAPALGGSVFVNNKNAVMTNFLLDKLKKDIRTHGLSSVARVSLSADETEMLWPVLKIMADQTHYVFDGHAGMIINAKHDAKIPRVIMKCLAVSPEIGFSCLADAIHRSCAVKLTAKVIAAVVNEANIAHTHKSVISQLNHIDYTSTLTRIERAVLKVFHDNPVQQRCDILRGIVRQGLNPDSASVRIGDTPIVRRNARTGEYSLVGNMPA